MLAWTNKAFNILIDIFGKFNWNTVPLEEILMNKNLKMLDLKEWLLKNEHLTSQKKHGHLTSQRKETFLHLISKRWKNSWRLTFETFVAQEIPKIRLF